MAPSKTGWDVEQLETVIACFIANGGKVGQALNYNASNADFVKDGY